MVFKWYDILYIYSPEYKLRFKGEKQFKSLVGKIMGSLTFCCFIIFFFSLFQDLLKRNRFDLYFNSEFNNNFIINLTNHPIFFTLIDSESNFIILNNNSYKFYVEYIRHIYLNLTHSVIESDKYELENCDEKSFPDDLQNIFDKYPKNYISYFKCFPRNLELSIKGRTETNNSLIRFYISKCDSNENPNCEKNLNESMLKSASLIVSYLSYSMDHFSFKHPIKKKLKVDIFPISIYNLTKTYYYYFQGAKYRSNNGIIIDDIKTYDFFETEQINFNFNFNREQNINKNFICVEFKTSEKFNIYSRIYKNYQYYLVIFQGFCNCVYLFFSFLSNLILLKLKTLNIVNEIFFLNKEDNNEKKNKIKIDSNLNSNLSNNNMIEVSEIKKSIKNLSSVNERNAFIENNKKNSIFVYEKTNLSIYKKYLKPLSYTFFQYFLPLYFFKHDKNIIILNKLKQRLYLKISVESLYYMEIMKNKESILNNIYSNDIIKYIL